MSVLSALLGGRRLGVESTARLGGHWPQHCSWLLLGWERVQLLLLEGAEEPELQDPVHPLDEAAGCPLPKSFSTVLVETQVSTWLSSQPFLRPLCKFERLSRNLDTEPKTHRSPAYSAQHRFAPQIPERNRSCVILS